MGWGGGGGVFVLFWAMVVFCLLVGFFLLLSHTLVTMNEGQAP